MTIIYVWVSAAVLIGGGLLWSRTGTLNMAIKLALFALGVWGLYCAFH